MKKNISLSGLDNAESEAQRDQSCPSVMHEGGQDMRSNFAIRGMNGDQCLNMPKKKRPLTPMNSKSYSLSFTAASLRPELARIIAESYLALGDWQAVKTHIRSSNALQSRSQSSSIRMESELRQRLGTLTHDQISLLATATAEDSAAMSWLAAIKHHLFLFKFASEVLREKLAAHDPILRLSDYEAFVDNEAVFHPELAKLTSASKNKIRQVLLRMLSEAGLLVKGAGLGAIQRPVLFPAAVKAITLENPCWLAGFLVSDSEIGSY